MKKIFSILLACIISIGTLPAFAAEEPIINNDFERGETGFGARGTASVITSTESANSGNCSMLISDRGSNSWEGAGTSIVNDIKLDETYYTKMYVKAADEGESFTVKMTLEIEDEVGMNYPQISSARINSSEWTIIEGTWTADYQGNIKRFNLNIETENDGTGKSFYVDDVFLAHESVTKPGNIVMMPEIEENNVSYAGNIIPDDISKSENVRYIDKLMSLGIVNGYPDGTFKPQNNVTRAEFLTMLVRLMDINTSLSAVSEYTDVPNDHFASAAISWATGVGICNGYGDGTFGPENNVTYAQAVKMLMSVMGYATIAEWNGGYPEGYMLAAGNESVGISGLSDRDLELTREMTAELISSALDVDLYMKNNLGEITRESDRTILSEYYDGDIVRGFVVSSSDTTTTGEHSGYGTVNINGDEYLVGATRASELVGYYVEFIYTEKDTDPMLLYIEPRDSKTEEFVIESKNLDEYSDYMYRYYEEGKAKTLKLEKDFTLIYNGKTLESGYDESMMVPELGNIRLVASDGGKYNIVYITSYETVIVASVNRARGDIFDINGGRYTFEESDDTVSFVKPDGSKGTVGDVKKNDVLHIEKSADGEKTTIKIMRSSIEGKVRSIDEEEITIDDVSYELSQVYLNKDYRNPNVGADITAYLDINGDVVYIDELGDGSMSVGYLLNAYIDDDGESLKIQYMTAKGEIQTTNVAQSITIDGVGYKSVNATSVLNILRGECDSVTQERIFRYTINTSDEIKKIDFARAQRKADSEEEISEGENTLYALNDSYVINDGKITPEEGSSVRYKYKYNAKTFIDESGNYSSIAIKPETVIFLVPEAEEDESNDEYEVMNVSGLGYDDQYKMFAYKTSVDGITADYIVLFKNGTGSSYLRSQSGCVVTKVFEGVNSEDENVPGFKVYIDGTEYSYLMKNMEVYEKAISSNEDQDIQRGDIVRFDTDSNGEISNLIIDRGSGKYGDYFYSAYGYVYMQDDGYAYFTTQHPNENSDIGDMILIPISDFNVTVYNKSEKQAYQGVPDDVIDYMTDSENYSAVYITMNYESARTLICITDE